MCACVFRKEIGGVNAEAAEGLNALSDSHQPPSSGAGAESVESGRGEHAGSAGGNFFEKFRRAVGQKKWNPFSKQQEQKQSSGGPRGIFGGGRRKRSQSLSPERFAGTSAASKHAHFEQVRYRESKEKIHPKTPHDPEGRFSGLILAGQKHAGGGPVGSALAGGGGGGLSGGFVGCMAGGTGGLGLSALQLGASLSSGRLRPIEEGGHLQVKAWALRLMYRLMRFCERYRERLASPRLEQLGVVSLKILQASQVLGRRMQPLYTMYLVRVEMKRQVWFVFRRFSKLHEFYKRATSTLAKLAQRDKAAAATAAAAAKSGGREEGSEGLEARESIGAVAISSQNPAAESKVAPSPTPVAAIDSSALSKMLPRFPKKTFRLHATDEAIVKHRIELINEYLSALCSLDSDTACIARLLADNEEGAFFKDFFGVGSRFSPQMLSKSVFQGVLGAMSYQHKRARRDPNSRGPGRMELQRSAGGCYVSATLLRVPLECAFGALPSQRFEAVCKLTETRGEDERKGESRAVAGGSGSAGGGGPLFPVEVSELCSRLRYATPTNASVFFVFFFNNWLFYQVSNN